MKKVIIISILLVLFNCKTDSNTKVNKPSGDLTIYEKEEILNEDGLDSISFVHFDFGVNQYLKGNFKEAKKAYLKADKIQPNNKTILNALGDVSADLDEYDNSIRYFEKALQIDSTHTITYINFGVGYNKLLEYDKSIEILKKGLSFESDQQRIGYFYYNLANSYYKKKDYKTSFQYNEKALDIVTLEPAIQDILELKTVLLKKLDNHNNM
jgi:tetratricopeptide (TPR) repeat protein